MNKNVNYITNRLSLRHPQAQSLTILAEIYETIEPKKNKKVTTLNEKLSNVNTLFPICTDFERSFPSICFSLATGVGKTRLMGACISFLFKEYGIKNFFVLAPNLTIYNKLIEDFSNPRHAKYVFKGIADFAQNPPRIVTGDNYKQFSGNELFDAVNINVFNISKINAEAKGSGLPRIKRLSEYLGESYFNYLAGLDDLVILMDESHHYRADRGMAVINELDPIIGLEFTATPQTQDGTKYSKFKNVVYEYSLAKAIADGFVKKPAVATRKDFDPSKYSATDLDTKKLLDGVRLHENTKAELNIYANDNGLNPVKPFVLVVAVDTTHAAQLKEQIQSNDFFGGYYKDKVMDIHSGQRGTEKDENIELLLHLEHPDNKIEIVIHVNMLKEGWDVTNLYTIIPLRTSASRTLTEQTIGRGLRLPYGKHTGYDPVDTLTIVQHDKFQDIIDEANKPDSIIKIANIIQIDADEPASLKEIITGNSVIKEQLQTRRNGLTTLSSEERKKEEIKIEIDEFILPFINKIAPKVNSFSEKAIASEEHINELKKIYKVKLDSEGNLFADMMVQEAVERYKLQAKSFVDNTIPIPRITIVPSGSTKLIFNNFDLIVKAINFQPGSEDIVSQELQSGNQKILIANQRRETKNNPEEQLILLLMDKPEIFYDDHQELLYNLISQLIKHLKSYLSSEDDVMNVVGNYKKPIVDIIYQQMMDNHSIISDGFEKTQIKGKPYSEIKDPSASKNVGDRIYDYKENIEPASTIRSKVFTGFLKAYHTVYKFDSKTEKDFAAILEKDASCLKWLKPALGQFNIHYGRPAKNYTPDFITETFDCIYMVETKKKDDVEDKDVLSKSKAAIEYCNNSSEYNQNVGGKPWKYILIPHDQVKLNMTLEFLMKTFEAKQQY